MAMKLTQEQINHYSELMAKFLDWRACTCGVGGLHYKYGQYNWEAVYVNQMKFHIDRNLLHRVREKFRDLKFEDLGVHHQHKLFFVSIAVIISLGTLEEAFLELGKGIEWYNTTLTKQS